MKQVQVRGVGTVAFPDEMGDDEIAEFLQQKYTPNVGVDEPESPAPYEPIRQQMDLSGRQPDDTSLPRASEADLISQITQQSPADPFLGPTQEPSEFESPRPPTNIGDVASTGPRREQPSLGQIGDEFVEEYYKPRLGIAESLGPGNIFQAGPGQPEPLPLITKPLSSVMRTGAGIADYLVGSLAGPTEVALSKNPFTAPAVFGKWALDMIKGGAKSFDDLAHRFADLWTEYYMGTLPDEDPQERSDRIQGMWDDAVNAAVMIPGGLLAGKHALQSGRRLLPGGKEKGEPTGRTVYEKPKELDPRTMGLPRMIAFFKGLTRLSPAGLPRPVKERGAPVPVPPVAGAPVHKVDQPQSLGERFQQAFDKTKGAYASGKQKAAEIYGTLRAQSKQGQQAVPAEKGGPGVQQVTRPVWQQAEGQAPVAPPVGTLERLQRALADAEEMLQDAELPEEKKIFKGKVEALKKSIAGLQPVAPAAAGAAPAKKKRATKKKAGAQVELSMGGEESFETAKPAKEFKLDQPKAGKLDKPVEAAAPEVAAGPDPQIELALGAEGKKLVEEAAPEIDVDIDVIDLPVAEPGKRPEDPFSRKRGRSRAPDTFMGINREKGSIEIYPEEFRQWLEQTPPEMRAESMRSHLWEEKIHLSTDPAAAGTYWNSLSKVERMIEEYSYSGGFTGRKAGIETGYGADAKLWGQEALRRRIQTLHRIKPSEIADTVGREKWTLKGLYVVETAIRGVREKLLRTGASKEGLAVLDQVQENLNLAKAVVAQQPGQQEPGSRFRKTRGDEIGDESIYAQRALLNHEALLRGVLKGTDADLQSVHSKLRPDDAHPWLDMRHMVGAEGRPFERAILDKMVTEFGADRLEAAKWLDQYHDALNRKWKADAAWSGYLREVDPGIGPGSRRRKPGEKRAEDLLKLQAAREGLNLPMMPPKGPQLKYKEAPQPISAAEAGALPALKITEVADRYIGSEIKEREVGYEDPLDPTREVRGDLFRRGRTRKRDPLETEARFDWDRPNFRDFARYVRKNVAGYANARPEQVAKMWEDAVWKHLRNASNERLMEWREALGMSRPMSRGGLGSRDITLDPERADRPMLPSERLEVERQEVLAEERVKGSENVMEQLKRNEKKADQLDKEASELRARLAAESNPFEKFNLETQIFGLVARAKALRRRTLHQSQQLRESSPEGLPRAKESALSRAESKIAWSKAYRDQLMSNVADRLIHESLPRQELTREVVYPEDIEFYEEFNTVDQASPRVITETMTEGARVSKEAVSVTRRLAVLKERDGDATHLVSAYKKPDRLAKGSTKEKRIVKEEGELMLVDPDFKAVGRERTSVPLSSIMKRYRVVGTALIKDPVQNFHQRFGKLSDFMDEIGQEALESSRVREYEGITGELSEQFETEIRRQSIYEQEKEAAPEGLRPEDIEEAGTTLAEHFERQGLEAPSARQFAEGWDAALAEKVFEEGEARAEAGQTPGIREGGIAGSGPAGRTARPLMGMGRGEISRSRSAPITANELRAAYEYLKDESRQASTPEEAQVVIRDMKSRALRGKLQGTQRATLSALQKISQAIKEKNPDLTDTQVGERALFDLYDVIEMAESTDAPRENFIKMLMQAYGEKLPGATAESVPRGTFEVPSRRERRRIGPGVESYGTGIREQPERMLTPEERAEIESRPVLTESKLTPGGELIPGKPIRYTPGQPPYEPPPPIGKPAGVKRYGKLPFAEGAEVGGLKFRRQLGEGPQEVGPGARLRRPTRAQMRRARRTAVAKAERLFKGTIGGAWTAYSDWMVDRLRNVGTPAADAAASTFNDIISREKGYYGKLSEKLDPARKAAGGEPDINPLKNPIKYAREARDLARGARWANAIEKVMPGVGIANMVKGIERGAYPLYAQGLFRKVIIANEAIGKLYEIKHPLMKRIPRFKAKGRVQRDLTAFGYDLVRQGDTPMRRRWVTSIARLNKVPRGEVEQFFNHWKEVLDRDMPDMIEIERVNQDYARRYKLSPTHLLTEAGTWEPVVHSDLFNYLEATARKATHIAAYRHYFPNTKTGRAAYAAMRESLDHLNATDKRVLGHILRTVQGAPTDNYSRLGFMAPGKPIPEWVRFVNNTLGNLMAKAVLTGQMFVQPGEVLIGSTPIFLGYKNYLKAMGEVSTPKGYKQVFSELEKNGAVNRVVYDHSWNPTARIRSAFKLAGSAVSKVSMQNFLNEYQELLAATTADIVANKIERGQLTPWEKMMLPQTFKSMGFNAAEVTRIMVGDLELTNQFRRRASAWLTTGNKALAEGSPIGANRLFNSVFRFQSYPMMKMNQAKQVLGGAWDVFVKNRHTSTPQEKLAAGLRVGQFLGGNVFQGALTVAFTTLAYKGIFGGQIASNEALDEPAEFMVDSLMAAMGGPLYLLWKGKEYGGLKGIGSQLERTLFPWGITKEIIDMVQGDTPAYMDKDMLERIGAFVEKKTPGTKAITTGMSLFGLGQEDRKLKASMEAFWKWRRDVYKGHGGTAPTYEQGKKFRSHMRKAVEAMKRGDRGEFHEQITQALGLPGKEQRHIASSLRARKILVTPANEPLSKYPDREESLRQRIGDKAYRRLKYYDLMLEAAAEGDWMWPQDR